MHPKAYLMYPSETNLMSFLGDVKFVFSLAAMLVGLAAAPLWTSKCSYLTETGTIYAERKSVLKNVVINRFFGIFFMFFQSSLSMKVR